MTLPATIAALGPTAAALITLLAVACIGILIWSALPARSAKARRDADIERQIKTLRHSADHAVATGYQTVYVREGQTAQGRSRVWRQSFGRWELRRSAGRWEIARRQSRAVS